MFHTVKKEGEIKEEDFGKNRTFVKTRTGGC